MPQLDFSEPGSRRFVVAADVRWRELGDGSVLVDLDRGVYFGLNETGTAAWRGVRAGWTVDEIHADLLALFDVDAEALRCDLEALFSDLVAQGLVTRASD